MGARGESQRMHIRPYFLILCVYLSSCSLFSKAPAIQEYAPGSRPVQFEDSEASTLELSRMDPSSGERWSARIRKIGNLEPGDPTGWEIESGPQGAALLDRMAHGSFLTHFISTLRTLQIVERAPAGPTESFGLAPPKIALRWGDFEIFIGDPAVSAQRPRSATERYAQIRKLSDKPSETPLPVYVIKGAALQMLDMAPTFHSLRQPTLLSPLDADDIDEIEIFRKEKPILYAQREGSVWTDRKHRAVRKDIDSWLEKLTHARIREYIDDPSVASKSVSEAAKKPLYSAILKDRHGKPTRVDLFTASGEAIAHLPSGREPKVFKAFPELIESFEPDLKR